MDTTQQSSASTITFPDPTLMLFLQAALESSAQAAKNPLIIQHPQPQLQPQHQDVDQIVSQLQFIQALQLASSFPDMPTPQTGGERCNMLQEEEADNQSSDLNTAEPDREIINVMRGLQSHSNGFQSYSKQPVENTTPSDQSSELLNLLQQMMTIELLQQSQQIPVQNSQTCGKNQSNCDESSASSKLTMPILSTPDIRCQLQGANMNLGSILSGLESSGPSTAFRIATPNEQTIKNQGFIAAPPYQHQQNLSIPLQAFNQSEDEQVTIDSFHSMLSSMDPITLSIQLLLASGRGENSPELQRLREQKRLERQFKIEKYKNKRRNWIRKISYDCRKRVADSRLRVKGRFISKKDCEKLRIDVDETSCEHMKQTEHSSPNSDTTTEMEKVKLRIQKRQMLFTLKSKPIRVQTR